MNSVLLIEVSSLVAWRSVAAASVRIKALIRGDDDDDVVRSPTSNKVEAGGIGAPRTPLETLLVLSHVKGKMGRNLLHLHSCHHFLIALSPTCNRTLPII